MELVFKKIPIAQGEGKRLVDINGKEIVFESENMALGYLQQRGWKIDGEPRYQTVTPPSHIFRVYLKKEITAHDQIEEGLLTADLKNTYTKH